MEALDPNAPVPLSLGQDLCRERERQGLSRAEVAQRLHMSAWQVEALESGDYTRLPQGTFLRGFVRNYSKILGLAPDAALDRLAEAAPRGPAPRIVVPSQNIRFDPLGERLGNPYVKAGALAVVFISLGFAMMYWWLFIRPAPPAQAHSGFSQGSVPQPNNLAAAPVTAPEPVMPRPAPSEPVKAEPPSTPAKAEPKVVKTEPKAVKAEPKAARIEPAGAVAPLAAPEAPKAEPRKAGERTLKLRFRGESWVEVKDRNGRVLLSRLNAPGSEAEVSGRPPFDVIIGNAPDVQMLYNDREFPLEPHTRVAVARFTLE
ncbi:MAG TPA: RodZ domain-containing protein [Usitatibacter sp.]|nr:RodZ domain-containing protein [Usitatibacter sp.]